MWEDTGGSPGSGGGPLEKFKNKIAKKIKEEIKLMKKRILSVLATMSLIVSLLPMPVMAAAGDLDASSTIRGVTVSATEATLDGQTAWTAQELKLHKGQLAAGNETFAKTDVKADTSGSIKLYWVSKDNADSVLIAYKDAATAEAALAGALRNEVQFDAQPLTVGDLVIVEAIKDASNKKFYVMKIAAETPDSVGALSNSNTVVLKGVKTSPLSDASATITNYTLSGAGTLATVEGAVTAKTSLTKKEAADPGRKNKIEGAYGEEVVAREVTVEAGATSANLEEAFEAAAKKEITADSALTRSEDGCSYVVIRVTPEDKDGEGEGYKWYVVKAAIQNDDASLKSGTIKYGSSKKDIAGSEGGTDEATAAELAITVPYADQSKLSDSEVLLKVDGPNDVAIEFKSDGTKAWTQAAFASEDTQTHTKETNNIKNIDLSNGKTLMVKVTSEDKSVTKYYKIVAKLEAPDSRAFLTSAVIIDDPDGTFEDVKVNGNLNTYGDAKNPVILTGEIPWDKDAANMGKTSIVVTASANASVSWKTYKSDLPNGLTNDQISDTDEAVKGEYTIDTKNCKWVYIKVTAENGTTENVYRVDLTQAKMGTESLLTDVSIKNSTNAIEGVTKTGLDEEPSTNWQKPTEIKVFLPEDSQTYALEARLTFSTGAIVTYYSDSEYKSETSFLGGVTLNKPIYLTVVPQDESLAGVGKHYYKVTVVKAQPTIEPEGTITVDPDSENAGAVEITDNMVVVDDVVDAETLLDTLSSAHTITITDASGNDVTGTGKVGTGYTVSDGTTELTVIVKGDVTKNGESGMQDALLALKSSNNKAELDEFQTVAGDMDNDGDVDMTDALIILKNANAK